jgi:hypothetical protein
MLLTDQTKQMSKAGIVYVKMKHEVEMHNYSQIYLWRVSREKRNANRDVMGNPEGKRFLERSRHR